MYICCTCPSKGDGIYQKSRLAGRCGAVRRRPLPNEHRRLAGRTRKFPFAGDRSTPGGWRGGVYDSMITDSEFSPWVANRSAAHVIVASLESLELEDEDRHHLSKARRLRAGEAVSVTDGRGGWRLCRFQADGTLAPDGEVQRQPRGTPLLTVGFAPVKGDRPEWAVQKLTEIGVDRILILSAERSVVRWTAERAPHHLTRLRGIIRQAVMQSRRVWVPELTGVLTATSLAGDPGVAMAAPGGAPPQLAHPTVLVGPEGGWSPSEEQAATTSIQLGPGILRTESAAVAAGVLLVALRAGLVRPA